VLAQKGSSMRRAPGGRRVEESDAKGEAVAEVEEEHAGAAKGEGREEI